MKINIINKTINKIISNKILYSRIMFLELTESSLETQNKLVEDIKR